QSVAKDAEWEVFYVDVDTDEVIVLGNKPRRKKLATTLRLPHYLRAYGYRLEKGKERPQPGARSIALMQTLITQVGSLEQPLGQLTWLAQDAEDKKQLSAKLTSQQQDIRVLEALLR